MISLESTRHENAFLNALYLENHKTRDIFLCKMQRQFPILELRDNHFLYNSPSEARFLKSNKPLFGSTKTTTNKLNLKKDPTNRDPLGSFETYVILVVSMKHNSSCFLRFDYERKLTSNLINSDVTSWYSLLC